MLALGSGQSADHTPSLAVQEAGPASSVQDVSDLTGPTRSQQTSLWPGVAFIYGVFLRPPCPSQAQATVSRLP